MIRSLTGYVCRYTYRVSTTEYPVEMESVELLNIHLRVAADVIDEPGPVGVVVVVQSAPLHPLYPVHRACTYM